jgi:predicted lipoprotein
MAVSIDVPLKLEYLTYEPASVFERERSPGATLIAYGEVSSAPTVVFAELHNAYALLAEPDEKLLLSMEIFCAARLEASQRATFLALVSALEPLAQEASLGPAATAFVDQCVLQYEAIPTFRLN